MAEIVTKINFDDFIKFFKDENNPAWGNVKAPCPAEPFAKNYLDGNEMNDISMLDLRYDVNYKWEVSNSNDESYDIQLLSFTFDMVKKSLTREPETLKDWEERITFTDPQLLSVDYEGNLNVSLNDKHSFCFTINKPENDDDFKLSYTIRLMIEDKNKIKRYAIIDPFIDMRNGDDPDQ